MLQQNPFPSTVPLAPDDLKLLQKFLQAWCEENGVDATAESAADVASALIDWYQFKVHDRSILKLEPEEVEPVTDRLQQLVRQLDNS
ncbi:hypothetical protein REJC140_04046 [Pseudorhizobium endolithicum]|uniref:Uncharacterized protein n=1 Tax=Pseudorhizobium endolithicum TaxID=1191678 RepID=A0ABN7JTD5_9HYPH|nr:hypothetical protein [Pseudorhizobium endolithicum]CAD6415845.1 hypothetical protein REQ54_01494 [Rhizobium sp. Q54]CAD7046097.1 hypothetical protein REJC140_04046 [Pseudorhizobium endolithicum]